MRCLRCPLWVRYHGPSCRQPRKRTTKRGSNSSKIHVVTPDWWRRQTVRRSAVVVADGRDGGSPTNSRFGGMAARASHWGASDAACLYLALGDEAEVPAPLVGSDALVAPRPATARSVTRQRAVGLVCTCKILPSPDNIYAT